MISKIPLIFHLSFALFLTRSIFGLAPWSFLIKLKQTFSVAWSMISRGNFRLNLPLLVVFASNRGPVSLLTSCEKRLHQDH